MLKKLIRQLRKSNNLTQEDVAEYLHIQRSTYSRYENGTNSVSIDVLCRLADLFNVSTDFLLSRGGGSQSDDNSNFISLYSNADHVHREIALAILKMGQCEQEHNDLSEFGICDFKTKEKTGVSSSGVYCSNHTSFIDYAVIARDDSMKDSGIDKGDYVIVRPQRYVRFGDLSLVRISKRILIRKVYETNDKIKLVPSNDMYTEEQYEKADDISIIGRVIDIVKQISDKI